MDKLFWTILSLSIVISFFYEVKANVSDTITYISIVMGFQTVSFSLLFSSDIVRKMYGIKSESNHNITLKHELKNYYKNSFNISIISVLLLLLIPFDWQYKSRFLLPIILTNSYMFYITNKFLYRFFIKEN